MLRLVSGSKMSLSSLAALQRKIRQQPELIQDEASRFALKRAAQRNFSTLRADIPLPLAEGGDDVIWPTASFPQALQYLVSSCEGFRQMIRHLHESAPSTPEKPWRLCIYFDENTPGAVLRLANRRKCMSMCIAIVDLGPAVLKLEAAWLPLAVLRTEVIKLVRGGWSHCLRLVLRNLLLGPGNVLEGVLLDIGGRHALFFFRLSNVLGDEGGLQAGWSTNGPQGQMCCLECSNVLDLHHLHLVEADRSGFLTTIKEKDVSKFQANTDEDIWERADKLTACAAIATKTARKKLERDCGLHWNPDGVLWDKELRPHVAPTKVNTHDAMHCQLSDGTLCLEIDLCMARLLETSWDFNHLRELAAAHWLPLPNSLQYSVAIAREKHFRKTGLMGLGASEALLFAPFLLFFLESVVCPTGAMLKEAKTLAANCKVMAYVQESKLGHVEEAAMAASMTEHREAYDDAYATELADVELYKPKGHYRNHLPRQAARDGFTIDCFVGERTHLRVKETANPIKNTETFELSVLERLYADLPESADQAFSTRLRQPMLAPEVCREVGGDHAWMGLGVRWQGLEIKERDVVFIDGTLLKVMAAACVSDRGSYRYYLVGCEHERISKMTRMASRYQAAGRGQASLCLLNPGNLRLPTMYFYHGDDLIVITHLQLLNSA